MPLFRRVTRNGKLLRKSSSKIYANEEENINQQNPRNLMMKMKEKKRKRKKLNQMWRELQKTNSALLRKLLQ